MLYRNLGKIIANNYTNNNNNNIDLNKIENISNMN